ncbi:MAG: tail fiber domain-containing protein [Acidobacteria bacterium]|nr:tail fiber domain-containing protein [Acidobacteriota bacterium]
MHTRNVVLAVVVLLAGIGGAAVAQPLGTFRWQLQPFCNVVTVAITQNGAVYRLEGTDDQCGNGADAASVTGTAFPSADGSIGFGLNIVTAPGGRPVHVDAEITVGTFSGTWRDSAGAAGSFVLTPGAGSGGTARPLPSGVPSTIVLRPDGAFLAGGALGQGQVPATGSGVRMMWYPGKAAFRAGESVGNGWDDARVGVASAALGLGTAASGIASFAIGQDTFASGQTSTAMGNATLASGTASTALGDNSSARGVASLAGGLATLATGEGSVALGIRSNASGVASAAFGNTTVASGTESMAIGKDTSATAESAFAGGGVGTTASGIRSLAFGENVLAAGSGSVALGTRAGVSANGSFAFGDRSSQTVFTVTQPNQFKVRAAGGVEFFSNPEANIGVRLVAGGVQWTSLSDVNAKHRFRDLDGEDVLTKFAAMPVREWSYKAQEDAIRHIGPTAQDFHAAFGLGEEPLRIGTLDADGVALAGVKAVEARTRRLSERLAALETENAGLQAELEGVRERLARLERALGKQ